MATPPRVCDFCSCVTPDDPLRTIFFSVMEYDSPEHYFCCPSCTSIIVTAVGRLGDRLSRASDDIRVLPPVPPAPPDAGLPPE